jgi:hypothetical protein
MGIDGYMMDAMWIGTIKKDCEPWLMYAFMTVKVRKAPGPPEVTIFGTNPDTRFSEYAPVSVEASFEKGQSRNEFQTLKTYNVKAFAVVIKVSWTMLLRFIAMVTKPVQICYIMKGMRLPVDFKFIPRSISATAKVCRRYRDGSSRLISPVPAFEADHSPPRATSRKSHSRHPSH